MTPLAQTGSENTPAVPLAIPLDGVSEKRTRSCCGFVSPSR